MEIKEAIDNTKFLINDLKANNYNQTFIDSLNVIIDYINNKEDK